MGQLPQSLKITYKKHKTMRTSKKATTAKNQEILAIYKATLEQMPNMFSGIEFSKKAQYNGIESIEIHLKGSNTEFLKANCNRVSKMTWSKKQHQIDLFNATTIPTIEDVKQAWKVIADYIENL